MYCILDIDYNLLHSISITKNKTVGRNNNNLKQHHWDFGIQIGHELDFEPFSVSPYEPLHELLLVFPVAQVVSSPVPSSSIQRSGTK